MAWSVVSSQRSGIDVDGRLELVDATGDARGEEVTLTFTVPSGSRVMAVAESYGVQRELTNFLKRHAGARKGYVALGGIDIRDIELRALRQQVIVLDGCNKRSTQALFPQKLCS